MLYAIGMFQLQLHEADIHVGYVEQPAPALVSHAVCFLAMAKRNVHNLAIVSRDCTKCGVCCVYMCAVALLSLCVPVRGGH